MSLKKLVLCLLVMAIGVSTKLPAASAAPVGISNPNDPSASRLSDDQQTVARQHSHHYSNTEKIQDDEPSSNEQNQELVLSNFINGAFQPPYSNQYLENFNPATGSNYGKVPDSDSVDIKHAVEAARRAFPAWSQTSRQKRSEILTKIADLLDQHSKEFAEAESRDQGKPVSLASSVDIPRAAYNFRYFAGKMLYTECKKTDLDGIAMSYTQRMPAGVCGLISPWNLPLYLLTWKIAPAIAFGNTCVCKPSEFTSVTAWMLCPLLNEAGVPPGVINMVFGTGQNAGAPLVQHPDVPIVSFTGGTVTGETIMRLSAPFCKKLSLELGGKNPSIIFDDADLEQCIATTVRSSFANQGEICLCGSRIFVQKTIYQNFLKQFVDQVSKLVVGDPSDPKTNLGALVSKQHLEKVLGYVRIAEDEGGEVVFGGKRVHPPKSQYTNELLQDGYYMQPTVIATESLSDPSKKPMDPMSCRITQEEVFGPVVTVTPFEDEKQVIEWANGVRYGLSASLWTENGRRQRRVADALRVGTVWVNCWMVRDLNMPFGGMKQSGVGREGGDYSHEFFTEEKCICLAN